MIYECTFLPQIVEFLEPNEKACEWVNSKQWSWVISKDCGEKSDEIGRGILQLVLHWNESLRKVL